MVNIPNKIKLPKNTNCQNIPENKCVVIRESLTPVFLSLLNDKFRFSPIWCNKQQFYSIELYCSISLHLYKFGLKSLCTKYDNFHAFFFGCEMKKTYIKTLYAR